MKKSMLTPAIIVISMMIFPANANASFLATLIEGGILVSKKIVGLLQEKQNEPNRFSGANIPPPTQKTKKLTPEEADEALSELRNACQEISAKGIPCAYSEAMGCTRGSAASIASTRSIQELAKSMDSWVQGETIDSLIQSAEGGAIGVERQEFISGFKSTVNTQVKNSQVFLSYESKRKPIEGEACKIDVYTITTVRVLNAELFNQAIVEKSFGEEISKKLIDASLKEIANKVIGTLPGKR